MWRPARIADERRAVLIFFLLHGLVVASWTVRIPDIKAHLSLSDGALGLVLLGPPFGAITGQVLVGWLLGRYGSKRITVATALAWCLLLPLLGLASNAPMLTLMLVGYGLLAGLTLFLLGGYAQPRDALTEPANAAP